MITNQEILDLLLEIRDFTNRSENALGSALYRYDKLTRRLLEALAEQPEEPTTPPDPTPTPTPTPPPPPTVPAPAPSNGSGVGVIAEDFTRTYYNGALNLAWGQELGDYYDAEGTPYGGVPFTSLQFPGAKVDMPFELDVTSLVRKHRADILIRGWAFRVYSRESGKGAILSITKNGVTQDIPVVADGSLHSSTVKDNASGAVLSCDNAAILMFRLDADPGIEKAILKITATKSSSSTIKADVFAAEPMPRFPVSPVVADGGEEDIIVRLHGDTWEYPDKTNVDGSLTVAVPVGSDLAVSKFYAIPREQRRDTMFSRCVLTLHEDFNPDTGGKLPGLCNTGQADRRKTKGGWGGRIADGTQWSCRTNRLPVVPGAVEMGFTAYAYRLNRNSFNGEGTATSQPLPIGRKFTLDQMIKLNTILDDGTVLDDGEVAYWIDGVCVGLMTGIRWRNNDSEDSLPSEYWLDVYIGGVGYRAPHLHTVTFHEAIVSHKLLPFIGN